MSLQINQLVLHQLVKQDENTMNVILRDTVIDLHPDVTLMVSELNRVYQAKSKAYGLFKPESQFAEQVKQYRAGTQAFLDFSRQATQQLRDEIMKYPFAEGGIVVFCDYRYLTTDYLLIAVLSSCDSMLVNDKLDVSTTHYLDIAHADIVARLDLTEWEVQPDSARYLTFLKGRVGRKVSDFFMDFLAAEEGLDTKSQNKTLIQAVDDYCAQTQLDKDEKKAYKQQVYSYCQGQIQVGEEIALQEVSQSLPADEAQNFESFVQNNDYGLEPQFPADKSTLRQLTKFSGSGGGLTIGFDSALLGDRISWDPLTDTLVIKGTPPNLRDQLKRNTQGGGQS